MTRDPREWTVLVTAAQSEAQPPIDEERSRRVLELLGGEDAWVGYPPASGRGHGFETRWWQQGDDAVAVAVEAIARYRQATAAVGVDTEIVLVHVATPEDRLNETVIGLERHDDPGADPAPWSLMLRAIAGTSPAQSISRANLRRLLERLPGDASSGFARTGLVEVRFWIEGDDAVDASSHGAHRFKDALAAEGYDGWTIVRAHAASVAEAHRTAYRGVERRVRAMDAEALPVVVRWPPSAEWPTPR